MNIEIKDIQKNMQTTFKGQVNGRNFTSRNEMNAYIGECITNGTPLTDISYSTISSFNSPDNKPALKPTYQKSAGREAIRKAQNEISWITYINNINQRVPEPYDNVIGYVVPFIREDINIDDSNIDIIINDFRERLNGRMVFLENMIFTQIRTWKYDENQVSKWLELLINSFDRKLEWANKRTGAIEDLLNNIDNFIASHIDDTALRGFYAIYSETAGFCSAIIDIIKEIQQDLTGRR